MLKELGDDLTTNDMSEARNQTDDLEQQQKHEERNKEYLDKQENEARQQQRQKLVRIPTLLSHMQYAHADDNYLYHMIREIIVIIIDCHIIFHSSIMVYD